MSTAKSIIGFFFEHNLPKPMCGPLPKTLTRDSLPYLWPEKGAFFLKKKNIPNSRLGCKNHTLFMTKMTKIDTLAMTKTFKNPTLLGRTYLYSPYKGVPPGISTALRSFQYNLNNLDMVDSFLTLNGLNEKKESKAQ